MSELVSTDEPAWDREISPRRGLLDVPLRELWKYRDLVWMLAWRDLTAQYKQTVLGPIWIILQPLFATTVFSFLFGRMAGLGTDHTPHFVFYMAGLVPWSFLSENVNKVAATFTRNAALFGKVYFPRLAAPFAMVLTNFASFCIQMGVFLVGLTFYLVKMHFFPDPAHPIHLDPNWRILIVPVLILQVGMLGMGAGLLVSSLSVRYRDLTMAVGTFVQFWMYASSVVFPLERVPREYQSLMALNPMVPIIEAFRLGFTGSGAVTREQWGVSLVICALVFLAGIVAFNRTEQNVMDTL